MDRVAGEAADAEEPRVTQVLLCGTADDGDGAPERLGALARAWLLGAPRCAVEVLAVGTARGAPAGAGLPARPAGVFVPLSELGLASACDPEPVGVARLRERAAGADLVVAYVPQLDAEALDAGPVVDSAAAASRYAVPVVVLADRVLVTRRQWSAAGVSGVHELGAPRAGRDAVVARVARTWAPSWAGA